MTFNGRRAVIARVGYRGVEQCVTNAVPAVPSLDHETCHPPGARVVGQQALQSAVG